MNNIRNEFTDMIDYRSSFNSFYIHLVNNCHPYSDLHLGIQLEDVFAFPIRDSVRRDLTND